LPTRRSQNIPETKVRFSVLKKELKQRIDCLQCKTKQLLKKQFDYPFEKRIRATGRLPTIKDNKLLKQR